VLRSPLNVLVPLIATIEEEHQAGDEKRGETENEHKDIEENVMPTVLVAYHDVSCTAPESVENEQDQYPGGLFLSERRR
jgi:hypothetical protein